MATTATLSPVRRQQLLAESSRRCGADGNQAYVLCRVAERDGRAYFSAGEGYEGLVRAALQLQDQGWLAVTGPLQNLAGRVVICCTAA